MLSQHFLLPWASRPQHGGDLLSRVENNLVSLGCIPWRTGLTDLYTYFTDPDVGPRKAFGKAGNERTERNQVYVYWSLLIMAYTRGQPLSFIHIPRPITYNQPSCMLANQHYEKRA